MSARTEILLPLSLAALVLVMFSAVGPSHAGAFALVPLYGRFAHLAALEHERRVAIVALLTREGPLPYRRIAAALGVDRSTVVHHADVLVRAGLAHAKRRGRHLYLALLGQKLPEGSGSERVADVVVQVLRENGGAMPRRHVHDAMAGVERKKRNGALRRLVRQGVIERSFTGSREILRLAEGGRAR